MTLARGMKVGVYEVIATLGRGGMGEVFRAHDTKLRRDVALKVLPDSFATDPDRLARFQREAQVLASLNHPHIAAIYGLDESGAIKALVLELVEGPTLADRIAQGPLPLDETRAIARQIAQALEAAHEQGIIHRDLKPANIKVKDDGTVKVLDFGLAKALEPTDGRADISQSPTITSPAMTQAGVLLGTAAYVSPELAKGRAADKRSDIWAFGCVLYEMLAGKPAFDGDGMAEVLGAVVRLDPDWAALPDTVPPSVLAVLQRCLQKDPKLRMRDIADVRFAIDDTPAAPLAAAQPSADVASRTAYAGWVVAALVAIAAAIVIASSVRQAPAEFPETRLEIVTPPANDAPSLAISPDGRSVVFQAGTEPARLWLRPLDSHESTPLTGTDGATMPFWSPDSRSIGFFVDGVLKRVDLDGGFVRTLATTLNPRGGAWNSDGTILIGAGLGPLGGVSANGGAVKQVTRLLPGQVDHRWPQVLPGGRFLLFSTGASDVRGLYLGSLADMNLRRVSDRESAYVFMPPAYVLLARQGVLWARTLNTDSVSTEGELVPVAPKVLVHGALVGFGAFSTSSTGSIAYRASARQTQLVWLDRAGRPAGVVGQPDDAQLRLTHMSSGGRTAVVERTVDGNRDVWLIDTERGVPRRLTFDAVADGVPILSPDGSRVAYSTDGTREFFEIQERRADGTGGQTLVLAADDDYKQPQDWSPDGRYILYAVQKGADPDLWALPLFGDRKPFEVSRTPFVESNGRFSPDGRWVAYASTEAGRSEIYVQPFPGLAPKSQISLGGGTFPRWRRDGRELFYLAPDNRLMTVTIAERGSSLDASSPRPLFTSPAATPFEPSPDGQRFLVNTVVSEASPISIILNWKPPDR